MTPADRVHWQLTHKLKTKVFIDSNCLQEGRSLWVRSVTTNLGFPQGAGWRRGSMLEHHLCLGRWKLTGPRNRRQNRCPGQSSCSEPGSLPSLPQARLARSAPPAAPVLSQGAMSPHVPLSLNRILSPGSMSTAASWMTLSSQSPVSPSLCPQRPRPSLPRNVPWSYFFRTCLWDYLMNSNDSDLFHFGCCMHFFRVSGVTAQLELTACHRTRHAEDA